MMRARQAGDGRQVLFKSLVWRQSPSSPSGHRRRAGRGAVAAGLVCLCLLGLAGCGGSVVDSSPHGIWIRKPLFALGGGIEGQARDHCAQFGRNAELSGDLDPGAGGNFRAILAYDCVDRRP